MCGPNEPPHPPPRFHDPLLHSWEPISLRSHEPRVTEGDIPFLASHVPRVTVGDIPFLASHVPRVTVGDISPIPLLVRYTLGNNNSPTCRESLWGHFFSFVPCTACHSGGQISDPTFRGIHSWGYILWFHVPRLTLGTFLVFVPRAACHSGGHIFSFVPRAACPPGDSSPVSLSARYPWGKVPCSHVSRVTLLGDISFGCISLLYY